MKLLFLLFVPLLVLPVQAFAQSIEINYDECMVVASPENFYWPFEVITRHDPAIAQRITDRHVNNPDAQIAISKPDSDKAEDATWISFKNSFNQTANWEVQLDLEYLKEKETDREIVIEMYSNNKKVNTFKLLQDGKNFCIVYNLIVSNPPHEWTDAEIIAVSSSLTKDEFTANKKEIAKMNVIVGDGQRFDNIQTLVLGGLAVSLIVGGWKARDRIKVELKLMKWEREQLEDAKLSLTMNDDYRNLQIKQGLLMMAIEKSRIYGDVISMVQVGLKNGFNEIKEYFNSTEFTPSEPLKEFEKQDTSSFSDDTEIVTGAIGDFIPSLLDPSDPDYIPGPVEYDIADESEKPTPGLKERLAVIKSKLPFGSKEKTFEEYTEDYLYEELKDFDSKSDKVKHLKELWDERIKIANDDPLGVASREVEIIRKVWQDLLI